MIDSTNPLQSIQTPDLLQERLTRLRADMPDLFTNEGQLNINELLRLAGQQGREHFDFQWWGKSAAKRNAFTPTTAALRYDAARSVHPDKAGGNAIIEGENLEVLKLLLCAYRGQVKCIYIDPPYNTGNDFVYKDNFKEGERAYWEQTGVTQDGVKMSTNTRADGRYHSNWLNMIYPRLLVARQLLREDGVIFVSIDDNEVTHLRKVMDEVFGEENFIAQICHKARASVSNDKIISSNHNHVLLYAKAKSEIEKFRSLFGIEPDLSGYTLQDDTGDYKLVPVDGPGGAAKGNPHYTFMDVTGYFRFSKETMQSKLEQGLIVKKGNSLYQKIYRHDAERTRRTVTTWWDEGFLTSSASSDLVRLIGGDYFDHPKSVRLLKQIISLWCNEPNDLILDFFFGSGTTGHAVLELSASDQVARRFIGVQIPEATDDKSEAYKAGFKKISDITIERVKRVIQGYGDNPQPIDAGFKVFTLQKSAFPRADFAPDPDATEADQLAALKAFIADKEASLFNAHDAQAVRDEVLLKCGFQLDVQLTPIAEVTANPLYRARDQQTPPREAIVCFDSHLDTTTLEWLSQQKGHRVIVLEAALDTTAKWNLHHQLSDGLVVF